MSNTRDHASESRSRTETWWATVYCFPETGIACFTFVDCGVGIFNSVKLKPLKRFLRASGYTPNSDILKQMFHRKIESRTGLHYRGEGLPRIFDSMKRGGISNLVVVSNDAYANLATDSYQTLSGSFTGTVVYWGIAARKSRSILSGCIRNIISWRFSMSVLNIATDFSRTPGPRSPDEGPYSGEEFLANVLKPKFEEVLKVGGIITVNLDGSAGYASSSLEASFGGLARAFSPDVVSKHVKVISTEEPYLLDEIVRYIKDAKG